MPRYFFSTGGGEREVDEEGLDLRDHAAARVAAIKHAGTIMENEPDVGRDFRVEVTDDRGLLLFTIIALAVNAPAGGDVK